MGGVNLQLLPLWQFSELLIEVTNMVKEPGSSRINNLEDCTAYCTSFPIKHCPSESLPADFKYHKKLIIDSVRSWGLTATTVNTEEPYDWRMKDLLLCYNHEKNLHGANDYTTLLRCLIYMNARANKDAKIVSIRFIKRVYELYLERPGAA